MILLQAECDVVGILCMGGMENMYTIVVRIAEVKSPLGRHMKKWEDNIKMDCKKTARGCELDSSGTGQGPKVDLVDMKMTLWVP
jgi:hypothetical protein